MSTLCKGRKLITKQGTPADS
eukprot:SAG31_NODE_16444_length_709_cov_0.975410_1_plen_20_part_01